jgi:diaminopimelate epimerase
MDKTRDTPVGHKGQIRFAKYHGLGNDYLVIDPNVSPLDLTPEAIRLICHRHFGVGADGILSGPIKDGKTLKVRIFNPDGSEAEKSGNGLRIFARYLFEHQYVPSGTFSIQTIGGRVRVHIQDQEAASIQIEMGKVTFRSTEIPVAGPDREVVAEAVQIGGQRYQVTCLSIGNPHCVIPLDQVGEAEARHLGPLVENHLLFPHRINMQLMRVLDRHTIDIRIWERGAGYTLASGSSSCAAAAAALRLGLVDSPITVRMPGGELLIEIGGGGLVQMTGPVEGIMTGTLLPDLVSRLGRA